METAWRTLGEGAAQAAPTAPHATPRPGGGRRNGPERFWASHWPVRFALALSLLGSGIAHCAFFPLRSARGLEVKDVEGEAAIPIDVAQVPEQAPTAEPPPAASAAKPAAKADDSVAPQRSPRRSRKGPAAADAGTTSEGGAADAGRMADASTDGASEDASGPAPLAVVRDAGGVGVDAGASVPLREPQSIVSATGAVSEDEVLVTLVVNAEVIRHNQVGAQLGPLVRAVPQWADFLRGTDIDPVRDADWILISGPSLASTSRDVILVRYTVSDAVVDKAAAAASHNYDKGRAVDAGAPGMKAWVGYADRAERFILRPQSHVLVLVPPAVAQKVAKRLSGARIPAHVRPEEAVYLRLAHPHRPVPELPELISEMRARVVPRPDQGADVFLEGDTPDHTAAAEAASEVERIFRRHNDAFVSLVTHGLLDHVEVSSDGTLVKARLTASLDQLQTLAALASDLLGVSLGDGGLPGPPPP